MKERIVIKVDKMQVEEINNVTKIQEETGNEDVEQRKCVEEKK